MPLPRSKKQKAKASTNTGDDDDDEDDQSKVGKSARAASAATKKHDIAREKRIASDIHKRIVRSRKDDTKVVTTAAETPHGRPVRKKSKTLDEYEY